LEPNFGDLRIFIFRNAEINCCAHDASP
jgi:hypothetical protein